MAPTRPHPPASHDAIAVRQHGRSGQDDAVSAGENKVIVGVSALDTVAAGDLGAVDGGHRGAVEDGEGGVEVGGLEGGEVGELGFEEVGGG